MARRKKVADPPVCGAPARVLREKYLKIEAHGVRGVNCDPWRGTFENREALNKWVKLNDAVVHGIHVVEG